jgi:4-hydroxy-tetrahydrodipicolinate synthase
MVKRISFFGRKEAFIPALPISSLQGLIVPLITPLKEDLSIDEIALKTLTARLMNRGVKNFFVLSNFSEGEYIVPEQKQKIMEIVSKEIGGKGLMIVGCFGSDTNQIIESVLLAQKFTNLCVVNAPIDALERELGFVDFFDSLFINTTANILLYNNPIVFKRSIPALWLDNIINWERLSGVIDSSRNPDYLDELGKYYQFTKLFEENEELAFDALRRGFSGLCCASSILLPAYYLSLINDFPGMDYARIMRMESKVSAVYKLIPHAKKLQVIKHILSLQGLILPFHSVQIESLSDKEKKVVEGIFHLKQSIIQK